MWARTRKAIVESFKGFAAKDCYKAMFLDLLTVVTLFVIYAISSNIISMANSDALPIIYEMNLRQANNQPTDDRAEELVPILNKTFSITLAAYISAFILVLFCIAFFYGRAWEIAKKRKPTFRFIGRNFLMNLIWFSFLGIFFFTTGYIFVPEVLVILFMVAIIFLAAIDPYRVQNSVDNSRAVAV